MSRRSRAREVVLQLLYQQDLCPGGETARAENFLRGRLGGDADLIAFATELLTGVLERQKQLDELLAARTANWSLERMAVTDRNVLRLGAFEILHTTTPGRVVINEALELAKRFGSKSSAQFVNGLLDRLLKEFRPEQATGGSASPSPPIAPPVAEAASTESESEAPSESAPEQTE